MVKLSGGREVTFDLNRITVAEWRALFDADQSAEDGDATLAKAAGLTAEEIAVMGFSDYRRLTKAFFEAAKEPLADPS